MMEPKIATDNQVSKEEKYSFIVKEIASLINDESDMVANLANTAAVLKYSFEYISWVGFYLLKEGELVLGPFQGKPACIRISPGKGVCGTAAVTKKSIIVPDVRVFPGHIFCDADTLSEIVTPLQQGDTLLGVLDVDSHQINAFDSVDQKYLEEISNLLSR